MAEVGLLALSDASSSGTLDTLERDGFYERRLCLASCFGSRDGARVLRFLADPSLAIRGLALALVPLVCSDEQALQALLTLRPAQRRSLLKRLYKTHRQQAVDACLDVLTEPDNPDLVTLLPYGSRQVVERHLDSVLDSAGQHEWRRLARLHPEVAAGRLLVRARETEGLDQRLVWQASLVLPILSRLVPDRVLELVRELARNVSLAQLRLQELVSRRPQEMAELVLSSSAGVSLSFERVAHKLSAPTLIGLEESQGVIGRRGITWFRELTPRLVLNCFRRSSLAGGTGMAL